MSRKEPVKGACHAVSAILPGIIFYYELWTKTCEWNIKEKMESQFFKLMFSS